MKKIIITVFIILISIIPVQNTSAQIQFFDSVKTVVSSPVYDYTNPKFDNEYRGFHNGYSWLVYERHNGGSSDIVIRKAMYSSYGNEILITNSSGSLNINPTVDNKILVWQSNAGGNWDLYYSIKINDSSWSSPILMDSSADDETNPYVVNNPWEQGQNNYSYLVYKRNNSIRFKRYKTSTGIWDNDTLVTDGTYEDTNPLVSSSGNSTQFGVVFLRKLSGSVSKLNQRVFHENYTGAPVSWEDVYEIYQPNSQNNLLISYLFPTSEFIVYSYDTLNSTHMLGFRLMGQDAKEVITKNIPGKHLYGKGSAMDIPIDNGFYFFNVFSALSRYSDSMCITFVNNPGSFNENPYYKKIYLGDTNTVTKFDVSQAIFSQNYFRIKTVWEKFSGNRTELVESYMTDLFSSIINNNSEVQGFYLEQNYPNPFNPKTVIRYSLIGNRHVSLKVFDALGKEVATLINKEQSAGSYSVTFNAGNLPSGVYFYRLESEGVKEIRRMLLVK